MNKDTSTKDPRLISYNTLRKAIGWMGISLPAVMIAGNFLWGHCSSLQDSNSHYYYTVTGNLFTGILCAVALFLLAYKGFDRTDHITSSLAGFFALGIAMFPTNDNSANSCAIIHLPINAIRNYIHYCFAAAFFISLACISLFLFTKSKGYKTKEKKLRNKVYRSCGIIIFIAVFLLALYSFFGDHFHSFGKYKPVFWLEWIALGAFGASWLVKGELILKDSHKKTTPRI
ncbi:MAG: hypothetical protein H0W12_01255 [Chitinophagaceae bacterium]|nr:hypothetical protein [Chitinophagaceae bacterium]